MLLVAPVLDCHRVPVLPEELALMHNDPDLCKRVNVVRSPITAVTHVDYSARVQTVERPAALRALRTHLTARDLEITIVSTADELRPKLESAGLLTDATVDVVPYDSY